MTTIPDQPGDFFRTFIPERFAAMKDSLAGKSSSGSMAFKVGDAGQWSFRVTNGELKIEEGMQDDVILQVNVSEEDFKPLFVQAAQISGDAVRPEQQVLAFKGLTVDEQKANLVRGIQGTVAFIVQDGAASRRVSITPGKGTPKLDTPDCRLECAMTDFLDMQLGKVVPMQLAMSGKIKIVGNAQIPMALSGVFL